MLCKATRSTLHLLYPIIVSIESLSGNSPLYSILCHPEDTQNSKQYGSKEGYGLYIREQNGEHAYIRMKNYILKAAIGRFIKTGWTGLRKSEFILTAILNREWSI